MINLDSVLKSKDITLLTKVHVVKAMAFSAVVYGCESCTIKKAERGRTDAFRLWCWRRLLRAPWRAKRSNQSVLKEINLNIYWQDWYLSWSSNTLATWCEEPTHWKRPWCCKRLRAMAEVVDRGYDDWMTSPIQGTWIWVNSRRQWRTREPGVLQSMGSQRVRHDCLPYKKR